MQLALRRALHKLFDPAVPLVRALGSSCCVNSLPFRPSAPGTARTKIDERVSKAVNDDAIRP